MAATKNLLNVNIAETMVTNTGWTAKTMPEVREWTITIEGTGYRCVIRECPCGLRTATGGTLTSCACKVIACRNKPQSRSGKCHGWHRARIDKVFGEIARPQRIKTSLKSYQLT